MSEYRLNDPQKGIIGPLRLSTLRDLIDAGVLHPKVLIAKDGGPFVPFEKVPEVATLKIPTTETAKPSYVGDLGKNMLFKLLHRFYLGRTTGLLVVQQEARRKELYLIDGQPVLVFSNVGYERLGEHLVLRGKLRLGELMEILQEEDMLLGEALLARKLISWPDLTKALREQQMARLVDLCHWDSGRYAFYDARKHPGASTPLVPVPELMLRAARSMPEGLLLKRLAPLWSGVVRVSPRMVSHTAELRLSETERGILRAVDGKRPLIEIIGKFGQDDAVRSAALVVLFLGLELEALQVEI
jgi:hypothetical protein